MLICFLISVAITGLGVFIAAGMRSMQGFQMLMNFLVMPLYFLSGAMFPVSSAPRWMKVLMTLDPLTYGVDALAEHRFDRRTSAGRFNDPINDRGGSRRWARQMEPAH